MEMPSRVVLALGKVLLLGVILSTCSCLKLKESPAQNLGPILIATTPVDTTPKYRYFYNGGSGGNMGLYTVAGCGSGLISGTLQLVSVNQKTAYSTIQAGPYYFGMTTYGQCIAFNPVASGSYTLTDTADYTLSIASP